MRQILATAAKVGVVVASSAKDQSLTIVEHMVKQDKAVAAMVPGTGEAGTELYSANMRLLRGPGKTAIQGSLAQAPSANAYAAINDEETGVTFENGVRRGNAGTFESVQLGKMPNSHSGHRYRDIGWGAAAHPISSEASLDRFVEKAEQGMGALGQYREPTERELEKARLDRDFKAAERNDSRVAAFTREQFGSTSALHRTAIDKDAGRSIEVAAMDDTAFARRESERNAVRQAASAGQSMG